MIPLSTLLFVSAAFHELHADHADATSFLKSNWNKYEENYHPSYVLDDDPKTAWVEGKDGDGEGESITIPLSTLKSARTVRLVVKNGYQKSAGLLTANAAPAKVTVRVLAPSGEVTGETTATLARKIGAQTIDVPVNGGVGSVQLTIDSVTKGKTYRDTCISDVKVLVDSDVPYNANAEKAKRAALMKWIVERKATAAYFAKLPKEYPFASPRLQSQTRTKVASVPFAHESAGGWELEPGVRTTREALSTPAGAKMSPEDRALVTRLLELAAVTADKPSIGVWMSTVRKSAAPAAPDLVGRGWIQVDMNWVLAGDITFFEARGRGYASAKTFEALEEGGTWENGKLESANDLVVKSASGAVVEVYRWRRITQQVRSVSTTTIHELHTYDAEGREIASARIDFDESDMLELPASEALRVQRYTWVGGKVTSVREVSLGGSVDYESKKAELELVDETWTTVPDA